MHTGVIVGDQMWSVFLYLQQLQFEKPTKAWNDCCVAGFNQNHVPERGGNPHTRSIPPLTFNIGNVQYVILGAWMSKLPILPSMTSKCPSLPPSFQSHSCSLSPWKCSPWFFSLKRAEANLILAGHPFPYTGVSDYRREREGAGGGRNEWASERRERKWLEE